MMLAGDIRKGVIFDDGKSTDPKRPSLQQVIDFQHVKPGKGAAFVRVTKKDLITGKVLEETYNPSTKINDVTIERKEMMYLYIISWIITPTNKPRLNTIRLKTRLILL